MVRINNIGNTLSTYLVQKPLQKLSETKIVNKACNKSWNSDDAQKLLTAIGIGSVVLKDGYGCYLYVKQSLNNKKIPEDKRKFVAALDLTNGGLMIAMQLLMFATISRPMIQSKIFNKLFDKTIDRSAKKGYQAIIRKQDGMGNMEGKMFNESLEEFQGSAKKALGHFTSLIAATILGKRVVVPFIATPLADKAKAWMCRNDKPMELHEKTENTYDTTTPAAEKNKKSAENKNQTLLASEAEKTNLLDKFQKQKN